MAWEENISSDWHIFGQRIDVNGGLLGGNFNISGLSNEQYRAKIAYNSTDHNFLVTWEDTGTGTAFDVFGRLMDSTGAFLTVSLNLSNSAPDDQYHQSVVYNSVNDEFLVVWQLGGLVNDIYGQRVNAQTGALTGASPFVIYAGGPINQDSPAAAYDPVRNQYLVIWQDAASGYDINGQFIDASNGNPIGGLLPISTASGEQVRPLVVYNSISQQFLAVWTDRRGGDADVYGQYINAAARTLSGGNFLVQGGSGDQEPTSVSYNSTFGNILVASLTAQEDLLVFTLLGPPCGGIPTMTEWGMIIFMILAGLGSLYFLWRREEGFLPNREYP